MLSPAEQAEYELLVEYEERERERLACEGSLIAFFCRAWAQFDPAPLKLNWHHDLIAAHLEAVTRGEIRRLLINVPPRCSKTALVNIAWPAWTWTQERRGPLSGPQVRFMCVSYGQTLSLEIATTARRLVMGEWYQRHWGVAIVADQAAKEFFATAAGGFRLATSMGGATLGRGGDIKILDDPNSVEQAESEAEREQAIRTYDEALTTRETDPATSAEVIIMQRLHERDIAGHVLDTAGPDLVHLCLPMEYEERRRCSTPWGCDPRAADGELLWPAQFSADVVAERQRRLGPYASAGQMQQRPVTRGGGIIKREWWRLWPDDYPESAGLVPIYYCALCQWSARLDEECGEVPCPSCGGAAGRRVPFPEFSYRCLSVDTAYGERQENSWSAATLWGVWHDKTEAPRAMLITAWRGRPRLRGIPDAAEPGERVGLVERIHKIATEQHADAVLIERKTRGTDLYHELERQVQEWPFQLVWFEPAGSKAVRLEACVPLFADDRVWAPDKQWAETVIAEVAAAPRGEFCDLADTATQALIYLRRNGLLSMATEHRLEQRRAQAFSGRSSRVDIGAEYEGV